MKLLNYEIYIQENSMLFYSFILIMLLIIVLTIYLVYKELNKK